MTGFQDISKLKKLYTQKDIIAFRGEFLKKYSIREKSIRDLVLEEIGCIEQKNVIDIGCGNCSFLKTLLKKYPNNTCWALDIVDNPNCHCPEINFKSFNGVDFPDYAIKFDYILLMHMLYHVRSFSSFFQSIKSLGNDTTNIVITTKSAETLPFLESVYKKVRGTMGCREEQHFCLENGETILRQYFKEDDFTITKKVLGTRLYVDNLEDVLKYTFSTHRYSPENQHLSARGVNGYIQKWVDELDRVKVFEDKYTEVLFSIVRKK
jgi:hypothetical protein